MPIINTINNIILEKGSGGPATTPQSTSFNSANGFDETKTIGGPTNTLGVNWTGADIKVANLRLKFKVAPGAQDDSQNIDYVTITVYHQPPPPQEPCKKFKAPPRNLGLSARARTLSFQGKKP